MTITIATTSAIIITYNNSLLSGGSRVLKRGVPVCTWSVYLVKRNKVCEVHLLGESGGMPPPRIFFSFQTFWLFLVPFWGEIARVGWPTAKSSHFTPQKLQSSRGTEGKKCVVRLLIKIRLWLWPLRNFAFGLAIFITWSWSAATGYLRFFSIDIAYTAYNILYTKMAVYF